MRILGRLRHALAGYRDDESAECPECGRQMAPHRGVRVAGDVFCSEEHAMDAWVRANA
jgi:hypothetical protein